MSIDLILGIILLVYVVISIILTIIYLMAPLFKIRIPYGVNFLVYLLGIPFFLIMAFYYLFQLFPNFSQFLNSLWNDTIKSVNSDNFYIIILYIIPLITFVVIVLLSEFRKNYLRESAQLYFKYQNTILKLPFVLFIFGFNLAFTKVFIGDFIFEVAKIIMFSSVALYSVCILIWAYYRNNIYYILARLSQTIEKINEDPANRRLQTMFYKDFKSLLNLVDWRLPKYMKINDYELKSKNDEDIKYSLKKYIHTYMFFANKRQINILNAYISEFPRLLKSNEINDLLTIRHWIVQIYDDLNDVLLQNNIKKTIDKKDSFYYHLKSGKYSEVRNKIVYLLIVALLYLSLFIMDILVSTKLGTVLNIT